MRLNVSHDKKAIQNGKKIADDYEKNNDMTNARFYRLLTENLHKKLEDGKIIIDSRLMWIGGGKWGAATKTCEILLNPHLFWGGGPGEDFKIINTELTKTLFHEIAHKKYNVLQIPFPGLAALLGTSDDFALRAEGPFSGRPDLTKVIDETPENSDKLHDTQRRHEQEGVDRGMHEKKCSPQDTVPPPSGEEETPPAK